MEVKFGVHNPHTTNQFVNAQVDGENIAAEMRVFEVELISQDGMSGTLKLRFKGSAAEAAKALFKENGIITAVLTADA